MCLTTSQAYYWIHYFHSTLQNASCLVNFWSSENRNYALGGRCPGQKVMALCHWQHSTFFTRVRWCS